MEADSGGASRKGGFQPKSCRSGRAQRDLLADLLPLGCPQSAAGGTTFHPPAQDPEGRGAQVREVAAGLRLEGRHSTGRCLRGCLAGLRLSASGAAAVPEDARRAAVAQGAAGKGSEAVRAGGSWGRMAISGLWVAIRWQGAALPVVRGSAPRSWAAMSSPWMAPSP